MYERKILCKYMCRLFILSIATLESTQNMTRKSSPLIFLQYILLQIKLGYCENNKDFLSEA